MIIGAHFSKEISTHQFIPDIVLEKNRLPIMSKKTSSDAGRYNFLKYCYCINHIGKNVLIQVLKWYYKGGDKNYLQYLTDEYWDADLRGVIDSASIECLRRGKLSELEMPVLHTIMELVCSYYDDAETEDYQIGVCGPQFLLHCVEKLVLTQMDLGTQKPSLTSSQFDIKLSDFAELIDRILVVGQQLMKNPAKPEDSPILDRTKLEIMCLRNDFECHRNTLPVKSREESFAKVKMMKKEADKLISASELPKKKEASANYKHVLEHKMVAKMLKHKRKPPKKLELCEALNDMSNTFNHSRQAEDLSCGDFPEEKPDENPSPGDYPEEKPDESPDGIAQIYKEDVIFALSSQYLRAEADGFEVQNITEIPIEGIELEFNQKYSPTPGKSLPFHDIFNCLGANGKDMAEIVIVSGEAGIGKSKLMEYIYDKWETDPCALPSLDMSSVLLYIDLENNGCNRFVEWLDDYVKRLDELYNIAAEEILRTILEMKNVLIILDGYDESSKGAYNIVKDVMELKSENHLDIIISCRSQYVDPLYRQIPKYRRKNVCHLTVRPVLTEHYPDYVRRILKEELSGQVYSTSCKQDKLEEGLLNRLPQIYSIFGNELGNPMLLKMITKMWIENSPIKVE